MSENEIFESLVSLTFVIGADLLLAVLVGVLLLSSRHRAPLVAGYALSVAMLVELLPRPATVPRFIAACVGFLFFGKLVDFARGLARNPGSTFADLMRLLLHPLAMTLEESTRGPEQRPRAAAVKELLVASAILVLALATLFSVFAHHTASGSFLVDHAIKMVIFLVIVEAGSALVASGASLVGIYAPRVVDRIYLSLTPADFWRRYNSMVGAWLRTDVFAAFGGLKNYRRGIVAAFVASALVHEAIFALAIWEITGFQLAFFGTQLVGVAASPPLHRWARRAGPLALHALRAGTWLFALLTSIFFFASLARVAPGFYASAPWL